MPIGLADIKAALQQNPTLAGAAIGATAGGVVGATVAPRHSRLKTILLGLGAGGATGAALGGLYGQVHAPPSTRPIIPSDIPITGPQQGLVESTADQARKAVSMELPPVASQFVAAPDSWRSQSGPTRTWELLPTTSVANQLMFPDVPGEGALARVKRGLRQFAGRYITNVKRPWAYSGARQEAGQISALDHLKSIVSDKPSFLRGSVLDSNTVARDSLYRDNFQLPHRVESKLLQPTGPGKYTLAPGSLDFNPSVARGGGHDGIKVFDNSVLGGVAGVPVPGATDGSLKYRDTWKLVSDWEKGRPITEGGRIATIRKLLAPMLTPPVVEGTVVPDPERGPGIYRPAAINKQGRMKPTLSMIKQATERLIGGPADGKPDSDFDPKALAEGIKDEMAEHTNDPAVAKEIVKDHLVGNPKEYSKRASIFNVKTASAYVDDISMFHLPNSVKDDVLRFVPRARNTTSFPRYGIVVKELLGKCDPENLKAARRTVREESDKKIEKEFYDKLKSKYVLLVNDRVVDGHHFIAKGEACGCTCSINVLDLTPARFIRDLSKKAEFSPVGKLEVLRKCAMPDQSPDKLRAAMDLLLTHNVGSTLMGGAVGATAGALSPIDKKRKGAPSRLQRILQGLTIGGTAGLAGSLAAPQLSSKLNHAVMNALVLKPVGRVVTNTIVPWDYTGKPQEIWKRIKENPRAVLRSAMEDKPLTSQNLMHERDFPMRTIFGLPTRPQFASYEKLPNGNYAVPQTTKDELSRSLAFRLNEPKVEGAPVTKSVPVTNDLLGGVGLVPDRQRGVYKFKDRWDFDLKPGERVDKPENFLRHLMTRIGNKPVTFEGEIPDPALVPQDPAALDRSLPPQPSSPIWSVGGDKLL